MEDARDIAEKMRDEGKGIDPRPVRQSRQSARALPRNRPRDLARHRRAHHALRVGDGNDRHDHGHVAVPEGEEPGDPGRRRAAGRRRVDSRASASGRKRTCRRSSIASRVDRVENVSQADAEDDGAAPRARGRHLLRHLRRAAPARSRCASRARSRMRRSCSSSAIAATATCRPACSPHDALARGVGAVDRAAVDVTPVLAFDIETVPDVAGLRRVHDIGPAARRRRRARLVRAAATHGDRRRFHAASSSAGRRDRLRRCATPAASGCGRSARRPTRSPS